MLLDNKSHGKVGDVLRESIQKDARLSVISSFLSVYGFSALRQQLGRAKAMRLLLPANGKAIDTGQFRVPGLAGSEADRRFRNALDLASIAREFAQWLDQKAEVRSVSSPVPWNLFHVENSGGGAVAIHGSSPFTSTGLGFAPSNSYEMNTCLQTPAETASLLGWFESIWTIGHVTSPDHTISPIFFHCTTCPVRPGCFRTVPRRS